MAASVAFLTNIAIALVSLQSTLHALISCNSSNGELEIGSAVRVQIVHFWTPEDGQQPKQLCGVGREGDKDTEEAADIS